jgi:hypothetical protein
MKNNKTALFLALAAALALSGCATAAGNGLTKKYAAAVSDAAVAEQTEIVGTLDAIAPDNGSLAWNADKTKLKVVTWKSQSSYEKFLLPATETSSSEAFVIWVTLAPKIQEFCRNYLQTHPRADKADLDLRLKQYLGLHPDWQYDAFVELWVNPADIFRPCVDPSPGDASCELNFGNDIPQVKNVQNYKTFYQNLYFSDFRASPGVPWTGLGYTYDWGNPRSEVGASEYILSPSTPYTIEQAISTMDYCSP